MNTECNPTIFRKIGERHFVSNGRCFICRCHRFHNRCLFRICVATVVFICQPFTVGVCFDIKPSAGKSECQWRIATLFHQPSVSLSGLINGIALFVFHRITLLVQLGFLFVSHVFLKNSSLVQFHELISCQFLHFTLWSLYQSTIRHSMPLSKNGGNITA